MLLSEKPLAIELFAGAGGLMLGLEMAGFQTLLANEIHADPCSTLRYNFPQVPVVEGSIRDYNGKSLVRAAGLDPDAIPQIELLAGGPPCQGFSTAGLKDPSDPRNTLIGEFIRMIRELNPVHFIIENVPGLKSLHKGRLFENVLNELSGLDYDFTHYVLFAADYGVPQMRKRLIIAGSRIGKAPAKPVPTHARIVGNDLFTTRSVSFVSCGDAISDLPEIQSGETATEYKLAPMNEYQIEMRLGSTQLYNHEASKHKPETMEYYGLIPLGGTWLDIPVHLRNRKQGVQRWPLDGLARAITTEPTDFIHPTMNRIPTIRELARIQSFPDRYVFLGQRTTGNRMRRLGYCAQSQQVGNAVPPLLARAVGQEVMRCSMGRELSRSH